MRTTFAANPSTQDGRESAAADVAVSVIVPVHRDNDALERLLQRLTASFPGIEVVVAASEQDRTCAALCERHGALAVVAGHACRGQQLNAGAAAARGHVLWFLHADAQPPADAVKRIVSAVDAGAVGGCFRFAFADASGLVPWLISSGVALRCRLGGIAYGDQGLFATRRAFDAAGGFDAAPLFEEVPLVRGLRRQGRFARLDTPLPVSARRWCRDGWWRRSLHNRTLALRYMLGASPERLAERYGSGDRREDGRIDRG